MSQTKISQYDLKVLQILSNTHRRLNQRFPFIQGSRELSNEENQWLIQFGNESPRYKILVAAMAIDTYTETISDIFDQADSLLQILSICLSCAQKTKEEMERTQTNQQIQNVFQILFSNIINMTQSASQFNPSSPHLEIYRLILQNEDPNLTQNIYSSLKQENHQLKQRLRLNDDKIIDLQIKLTQILQEHDEQIGGIERTMRIYELREEIEKKERQIQKMNEQFCYEIEKYNVVYETLKRQLQEYKSCQDNVATVQLIEKLETEIIVLRQEKERQQMINEQLRYRLKIVTEANVGSVEGSRKTQQSRAASRIQYARNPYARPLDQYYYARDSLSYETDNNDEADGHNRDSLQSRFSPFVNRGYSEYVKDSQEYQY